jgi:hypothetical protein
MAGLQKNQNSRISGISTFTSVMYDGSAVFWTAVEMMVPGSCYRRLIRYCKCAPQISIISHSFALKLTQSLSQEKTTAENCSEAIQNSYQKS